MGKQKLIYWNIPVTNALNMAVEKTIKRDTHVSKSEFVRDACRKLLTEVEMVGKKGSISGDVER